MSESTHNPMSLRNFPMSTRKVLDRYGQEIHEGDLILIANNETHPHYVVRRIHSGTDPRIPKGHTLVEAEMRAPVIAQLGVPSPNFILVMQQQQTKAPEPEKSEDTRPASPLGIVLTDDEGSER